MNVALRAVQAAMGSAGVLDYPEVAERAGLDARTVRGVDDATSIGTIRKIAKGLDRELVIEFRQKTHLPDLRLGIETDGKVPAVDRVLAMAKAGVTITDLEERFGFTHEGATDILERQCKMGLLRRAGSGAYFGVEDGGTA